MQTVEWKVLVLKVLFLVGVESIVATKKKAKEGGKAIFLCISLLPFRGESFQHHPFGQQNPIQPARAKLYGLDIYFTGCPKDSGTQSTKAAIRSTEAHQRLSTSTLLNNAATAFCKELLQGFASKEASQFTKNSLKIPYKFLTFGAKIQKVYSGRNIFSLYLFHRMIAPLYIDNI